MENKASNQVPKSFSVLPCCGTCTSGIDTDHPRLVTCYKQDPEKGHKVSVFGLCGLYVADEEEATYG